MAERMVVAPCKGAISIVENYDVRELFRLWPELRDFIIAYPDYLPEREPSWKDIVAFFIGKYVIPYECTPETKRVKGYYVEVTEKWKPTPDRQCKFWWRVRELAKLLGLLVVANSFTTTDPCFGDDVEELYIEGVEVEEALHSIDAVRICEDYRRNFAVYLAKIKGKLVLVMEQKETSCEKVTGPCDHREHYEVVAVDPVTVTVKRTKEYVHCGPDGYAYEEELPPKTIKLTPP